MTAEVPPHSEQQGGELSAASGDLYEKVSRQLEFYLSRTNVVKDEYLRGLLSPTAFVPLDTIGNFHRLQLITRDLAVLVASVQRSSRLMLRMDWEGRYWVGMFPQAHERSRTTVILLGSEPNTPSRETFEELISYPLYHTYQFPSGVWYLTFEDPSSARNAFFELQEKVEAGALGKEIRLRIRTDDVDRGFGDGGGPQFQPAPNKGLPGGLVAGAMWTAMQAQAALNQDHSAETADDANRDPHAHDPRGLMLPHPSSDEAPHTTSGGMPLPIGSDIGPLPSLTEGHTRTQQPHKAPANGNRRGRHAKNQQPNNSPTRPKQRRPVEVKKAEVPPPSFEADDFPDLLASAPASAPVPASAILSPPSSLPTEEGGASYLARTRPKLVS